MLLFQIIIGQFQKGTGVREKQGWMDNIVGPLPPSRNEYTNTKKINTETILKSIQVCELFKSYGFILFSYFSLTPLHCMEVTEEMPSVNGSILLVLCHRLGMNIQTHKT